MGGEKGPGEHADPGDMAGDVEAAFAAFATDDSFIPVALIPGLSAQFREHQSRLRTFGDDARAARIDVVLEQLARMYAGGRDTDC